MKGVSASFVLKCAERVMLTPSFLIRYHCEFSQRFLRRSGIGKRLLTKIIGIMVEGRK